MTLVRSWLTKARRDLESAKRLASEPAPYLDTAIYHCQQCAEKAFLVYHDVQFEKVHNLDLLLGYCTDIDPEFDALSDAASNLTPYATAFRYPDEFFESEPERQQFDEALHQAEMFLAWVIGRLPERLFNNLPPRHEGTKICIKGVRFSLTLRFFVSWW